MLISRRSLIASTAAFAGTWAGASALPAFAAEPFVVYDDELKNGWQNWSWAKAELSVPAGGAKPIKVEGEPWSALALRHDPFSTAPYTKLTFFINGGVEGGQTLAIKALVDGNAVESNCQITLKAKSWQPASILLKDFAADNKTINGIWFQGQATAYPAYYITKIQFE
ncbi:MULTISPECIES: hypothetical protein [Asticcacaulis]|uniref:hypothetical protein n=1 Tax=Asticcacaulis TaxID=76890 RepID=UPI001AE15620|nr:MULTISPECIES: hypothetical protein [Asticcacaulis]MBP2159415.1 hypothetical protein [Asticcacaulis solisilvae]MDR6800758.1 hypothetical protein [Asticcacaulis sp. BE141]